MWRLDMGNLFRILENSKKLPHVVALSKENLDVHEYIDSSQPSFVENVNFLLHKEFTFTLFYCKKRNKKNKKEKKKEKEKKRKGFFILLILCML